MNSPGNSSSSHKGRFFSWFRRGRDPPKKPTHPRPRRRALGSPSFGCSFAALSAAHRCENSWVQPQEYVRSQRDGRYLDAREALDYGLIDEIRSTR